MRCFVVLLGLCAIVGAPQRSSAQSDPPLVGVTRDTAGRLYVGTPGQGVAMYLPGDTTGTRLVGSDGQPARGARLSWVGDTLAVYEWNGWKLFAAGGAPVGRIPFREARSEFATQVFPTRPIGGGEVIGELLPPWPNERVGERLVVARDQHIVRILASRRPRPQPIKVPDPRGRREITWSAPPPLPVVNLWSVADRRAGVILIDQKAVTSPGPQRVRVTRLAVTGDTVYATDLLIPATAVTERERERIIGDWARPSPDGLFNLGDSATVHDTYRRHVPFPAYHPSISELLAGADGSAWLRLAPDGERVEWIKLDPAGSESLRLQTDRDFHPLYVDAEGVWGVSPAGVMQYSLAP